MAMRVTHNGFIYIIIKSLLEAVLGREKLSFKKNFLKQ